MSTLPMRVVLILLALLLGHRTAEALSIGISESSDTGGGTIVNDGSGDVSSSNGSSSGQTDLMALLGFGPLTLESDLRSLQILGIITDSDGLATQANLTTLRLIGTVSAPCATCGTLTSVAVGGSLSLNLDSNGNPINPANVLFAVNLIGGALVGPWGTAPAGLPTQVVGIDTALSYSLNEAQVQFILSRMGATYGVGDVRLGLAASAQGLRPVPGQPGVFEFENVGSQFEIPQSVPEPGSLLLLGSGVIVALAARRKGVIGTRSDRRHQRG